MSVKGLNIYKVKDWNVPQESEMDNQFIFHGHRVDIISPSASHNILYHSYILNSITQAFSTATRFELIACIDGAGLVHSQKISITNQRCLHKNLCYDMSSRQLRIIARTQTLFVYISPVVKRCRFQCLMLVTDHSHTCVRNKVN